MKNFFILIYVVLSLSVFAWGYYDKDGWHKKTGVNKETGTLYDKNGFDKSGWNQEGINKETNSLYDIFGFNKQGFSKKGYNKETFTIFDKEGYSETGYNIDGYNKDGYDVFGFDKNGINKETNSLYDLDGYNKDRYNEKGFYINGINKETVTLYSLDGYNKDGYNKDGYNKDGYDNFGFNKNGFSKEGLNKETGTFYNMNGYDKDGYDKDGWSQNKKIEINKLTNTIYNEEGYTKNGFNKKGINKETKTKYDKHGFNEFGQPNLNYFRSLKISSFTSLYGEVKKIFNESNIAKEQFETTIEFEKRYQESLDLKERNIQSIIGKSYMWSLEGSDNISYTYDADNMEWTFSLPNQIKISQVFKEDTYNAKNAYGMTTVVTKLESNEEELTSSTSYTLTMPMERSQAKKVVFEFQLIYGFSNIDKNTAYIDGFVSNPTLTKPKEIISYKEGLNVNFVALLIWDKGKKNLLNYFVL